MFSRSRGSLISNLRHRICNERFYSVLYSCSHINTNQNTCVNHDKRKILTSNYTQQQVRNLSFDGFLAGIRSILDSLASSKASLFLKDTLIEIHDVTGLPWWSTIILSTFGLKLIFGLPPGIYQQFLLAKIMICKHEVDKKTPELKEKVAIKARTLKWPAARSESYFHYLARKEFINLVVKNNCHPFKNIILNYSQIPIWVLMSVTLRKMAGDMSNNLTLGQENLVTALELQVGGLFWCKNLLCPDETLILPGLVFILSLSLIELNILAAKKSEKKLGKILKNFFRIVSLLSFFITMNMPSLVSLYWASSLTFGFGQNLVLLSPKVKRLFRIPRSPVELEKPYAQIGINLKKRFERFGGVFSGVSEKK